MLAAAVVAGLALSAWLQNRPPERVRLSLTPVVERVLNDEGAPRIGASRPDVVIVVFTDYQCGICKQTDGALERLVAADPGVQVMFKDWPVVGPASVDAAHVALAADEQGKYLPVHRALMNNRTRLDPVQVRQIAVAAGADGPRLEAVGAVRRKEIETRLASHAAQAWSLGLAGTPGYLVGPYLIRGGLDDRDLKRAVAAARKAGPPAAPDA